MRNIPSLRCIALFALGTALLAGIGLTIELAFQSQPLLAAKLLRYYWFRLTDFAAAMAVALYATAIVAIGFERRRMWAVPILCAMVVAGSMVSCECMLVAGGTSQFSFRGEGGRISGAWVEVCDWIAANTPPDALFLTPRLNSSFKWRTGRPEVVNRKDIPQDAAGIVAWSERVKDIYTTQFGGIDQTVDSVGALGTDRVQSARSKVSRRVCSFRPRPIA